jgi:hypothetical protein
MPRHLPFLAAIPILAIPAAAAAMAGYVLFFQSFSDWATLCARDEAAAATACTADAPPPSLDGPPAIVLHVTETESGVFAVDAEFRANVAPGASAALRVDNGADYVAPMDNGYVARLDRDAAGRLVADMLAGHTLTVRAAGFGEGAPPLYVGIPLSTFRGAFERMRANLRQYGVIRDPG